MSSNPPKAPEPPMAIVSRLRAAGCVFAEDEAHLLIEAATDAAELESMVAQRVAGLPLEHLLGWVEFCGRRIAVTPGVFVPRRRTEFLVGEAAACCDPSAVVVDLCCGSGAVAAALLSTHQRLDLHASDIDPAAVKCARRNLAGGAAQVYQGDLFEPLPERLLAAVDVLVVNAPYVPTDAIEFMPPEARVYEPRVALDGGEDGLHVARRVVADAGRWLAPGGHLLIETSELQSRDLLAAFERAGLVSRIASCDEIGATIVIGSSA